MGSQSHKTGSTNRHPFHSIVNLQLAERHEQLIDETRFAENLKPTAILDWTAPEIQAIAAALQQSQSDERDLLKAAHRKLVQLIRPIYTLDELQPASVTIRKESGSCSQRMACLEAVARAARIPTRVRALRVKGEFWYPRFHVLAAFVPRDILLVWPQFLIGNEWVDVDEIYARLAHIAEGASDGFRNDGESIFDALDHVPVDFFGKTCTPACPTSKFDLSRFVVSDEGFFASRDEVFDRFGRLQNTIRGRVFEIIFGGRKSV